LPVGSIVRLRAGDLVQLENLLLGNNLPVEDCAEQAQNFYGIFDDNDLIAAGGLEPAATRSSSSMAIPATWSPNLEKN